MDEVARRELEQSLRAREEDILIQTHKWSLTHPYYQMYNRWLLDEVVQRINAGAFTTAIFVGASAGADAAYVTSRCSEITAFVSDLSYVFACHVEESFRNLNLDSARWRSFACDFNALPVRETVLAHEKTIVVAFQTLHHSYSIDHTVRYLVKTAANVILVEPLTNWLIKVLARIGVAPRKEHLENFVPGRISRSLVRRLEEYVESKALVVIPRDYLPFLTSREGLFKGGDVRVYEPRLSRAYLAFCQAMSRVLGAAGIGNQVVVRFARPRVPAV